MRNDNFKVTEKTIKIINSVFEYVSFAAYYSENLSNVFRNFFHDKSIAKLLKLILDGSGLTQSHLYNKILPVSYEVIMHKVGAKKMRWKVTMNNFLSQISQRSNPAVLRQGIWQNMTFAKIKKLATCSQILKTALVVNIDQEVQRTDLRCFRYRLVQDSFNKLYIFGVIRLFIQLLTTIVLVEIVPVNKVHVKKIRIFLEKRYQFSMDWMQLVKCWIVNWQILKLRWNLAEGFLNKVERRHDSLDGNMVVWRAAWKRRY